ncbi:amidase [Aestuariicella hydrocarbonica]|uniref:Amidase n=1 Tax=Pseudomaricurvus hydrocarbonicus TaxID=1470433 RepID=A0A9E5MN02_9GAMM|nr:amidase [Aestuariicella hydrocarbonica]NHO67221.1 amidase [Aestuariicella hydrocarbonica]
MTDFDMSLLLADATHLAELLQRDELSSESLTLQTLKAIERLDPALNCYISVYPEAALAAARASDERRRQGRLRSPLDGLTLAVKDNIDVAGMVTTAGLNIPADSTPAEHDAFVIAQLRQAGCVIIGKLNMHEAALGATNDNPHHGRCMNPHRPGFTPGGSSGGSGAAVAAGLCALALGTDTMGSVRIPASYCGVSGLKPTAGAVSIGGSVLLSRRLDNIGPLARSPRDLGLMMPSLVQQDHACAQSRGLSLASGMKPVEQLRFAALTDVSGVDTDISLAYTQAVQHFIQRGAQVTYCDLSQFDFARSRRAGLLMCEVDMYLYHQPQLDAHPEYYSDQLKAMMQWGVGKSAVEALAADWLMDDTSVQLAQLLSNVDVLLLPTAPQTAFSFEQPAPAGQADLTNMANMSGHPAISVPMGISPGGLPMGLQLVGQRGADRSLIELAQWFADTAAGQCPLDPQQLLAS